MWLRDFSAKGRHKIQDLWDPVVYRVLKSRERGGSVYTIAPIQDQSKAKQVHRTLLKAAVGVDPPGDGAAPSSPPTDQPSSEDELLREGELWVLVQDAPQVTHSGAAEAAVATPQPLPTQIESVCRAPDHATTSVVVTSDLPSAHFVVSPTSNSDDSTLSVRRTARSTAGQHSNVHRLPRSVGEVARGPVNPPAPVLNAVSAFFRPWS